MIALEQYRDKWLAEKVDEFIGFYTREFFCLDNFSSFGIEYEGRYYQTVEHAYQSLKFKDVAPEIEEKVIKCFSAHEAQRLAHEYIDKQRADWDEIKVSLMEEFLRAKLAQNPYVKKKLLQTENYLICEDSPKDSFWGIGPHRDGRNELGKLWMKLRKELQIKQDSDKIYHIGGNDMNQKIDANGSRQYRRYEYKTPPHELIKIYESDRLSQDELQKNARIIENVVSNFLKTEIKVMNIVSEPQATRYDFEAPDEPSFIELHSTDLAYELAVTEGLRIVRLDSRKHIVGIEIPNKKREIVGLREVVDSPLFSEHKSPVVFSVGKDLSGELVVCDLENILHLFIAGQTCNGKSEYLNSLILSLLYKSGPDDLRLILINPKHVTFSKFCGMPHMLFGNTVTKPTEALRALEWTDNEMHRRYTVFQKYDCSKLSEYNRLPDVQSGKLAKFPHIVIIIDEFADLMQSAVAGEIGSKINGMAAMARAAGIHLVVATQQPSADVITGTIKANLTRRIAFNVPDVIDSRIIIDMIGAELFICNDGMLFFPQDARESKRVQGTYTDENEVCAVVDYLKKQCECDFDADAEKYIFD